MKQIKGWTTEEKHTLKKYYGILPIADLLKLLPGRSISSIYAKVNYLRKRGWTFGQ
jgi:hypothetical protein